MCGAAVFSLGGLMDCRAASHFVGSRPVSEYGVTFFRGNDGWELCGI